MSEQTYGPEPRAERARLAPTVEAGEAQCAELVCLLEQEGGSRWIPPGSEWHLAHDRTRPGEYRRPAHPRCNSSEGGKNNGQRKLGRLWDHL